jgi:hypothetical protein
MFMVDSQGQWLAYLHTRDPNPRIKHDQTYWGADKDEIGFELGHGSRKEELHIGASRWELVDLQVELQIMHPNDGICFINLDSQRISLSIAGQAFFLCADLDRLITVMPPPA